MVCQYVVQAVLYSYPLYWKTNIMDTLLGGATLLLSFLPPFSNGGKLLKAIIYFRTRKFFQISLDHFLDGLHLLEGKEKVTLVVSL